MDWLLFLTKEQNLCKNVCAMVKVFMAFCNSFVRQRKTKFLLLLSIFEQHCDSDQSLHIVGDMCRQHSDTARIQSRCWFHVKLMLGSSVPSCNKNVAHREEPEGKPGGREEERDTDEGMEVKKRDRTAPGEVSCKNTQLAFLSNSPNYRRPKPPWRERRGVRWWSVCVCVVGASDSSHLPA